MNQAATQAAYQSVSLPAGDVTFNWNASGTELTINPNADLVYLATTDSNAAPRTYSFSLTNAATDLAGNKLANTNVSFSTFKVVTNTFTSTDALTKSVASAGGFALGLFVGDLYDNVALRAFVSFDIASLPAVLTGARILDAKLTYDVDAIFGSPTEDLVTCSGGTAGVCTHLIIESVNYGFALEVADFDVPAIRVVRSYRQGRVEELTSSNTVNALTSVQDDLDNRATRGGRSQFRYRFSRLTDGDNKVDFLVLPKANTRKPSLEVVYLYP